MKKITCPKCADKMRLKQRGPCTDPEKTGVKKEARFRLRAFCRNSECDFWIESVAKSGAIALREIRKMAAKSTS